MSMLEKYMATAGAGARKFGKGERILEDLAGLLGKGAGKAKGAAQWAAKEHPMATGAALGAGGMAALDGDDQEPDNDDDDVKSLLQKLGIG